MLKPEPAPSQVHRGFPRESGASHAWRAGGQRSGGLAAWAQRLLKKSPDQR